MVFFNNLVVLSLIREKISKYRPSCIMYSETGLVCRCLPAAAAAADRDGSGTGTQWQLHRVLALRLNVTCIMSLGLASDRLTELQRH
jgi:hypothetical protein